VADPINLIEIVRRATTEASLGVLVTLHIAAALSVPSVLLRRRGRPTSALAWILVLFAVPGLGTLIWWFFGRTRIERRLRKHSGNKRAVTERIGVPQTVRGTRFDLLLPSRAQESYAFSAGNEAKLLQNGKSTFAEILDDLQKARVCVHLQAYIFKYDSTGKRVCDELIACAKRGVVVRVLLDGFGCRTTEHTLKKHLLPHGVQVGVFFPARFWPITPRLNFVNHRKIITVDGCIGYTGGMNIGEEYELVWRDLMVRLEGPSVGGIDHVFLEDWYFATQQSLPTPQTCKVKDSLHCCDVGIVASGPDTEGWIHDSYFMAITQARERVYISTPYFIPTQALLTALRTASGRGVDVRLVLPSLSDVQLVMWASRSFYRPLVQAGVRIFEYSEAMLHAKALVVDDNVCAIGTANLDNRSFYLNFEVTCYLESSSITEELVTWLVDLLDHSEEVTLESLDNKSTSRKVLESAAHLMSPLL
jgi:cardiolipin synthase A/B